MGGIMCVTPATAAPKLKTLRRIKMEGINFHDDFDVDNFSRMDFLSLSRFVISCASPSWSGFMQIISRSDRSKDTTAITFLSFINLTPSNPSCIYTALKFAAKECVRHGQNTAIVTFDQPLFYKAMDIVSAMQTECELKNVIIRLGGFHFLMSFLGAIGYIMAGSGIEELFSTVYATNSVQHIPHLLASEALIRTIFNESEHSLQSELDKAKEIVEHLMENKILSSDICYTNTLSKLSDVSQKKRTSKLWSQYFHMVTLIRLFIRSERTGDWKLHMYCVRKMLPFLAAAGHLNYTKCAYLYYQSMQGLQSKMSEKTEIPWSGVWSDMIIEQSLMRSIKSVGGISHGRGYSESVLCEYINSLPVCAQFSECLEKFTGIESKSSEQHKDLYASRNKNDIKHIAVFAEWMKLNSPFSVNTNDIISLSTGAVGDSKINCELSEDIGTRILNDMKGKKTLLTFTYVEMTKLFHWQQCIKQKKIENDIVPINTNQIIHRMMCLNLDKTDQKASMCFELAAVSTALFDENGTMRRGQKSKLQELLITYTNEEEQSNDADLFVIDGDILVILLSRATADMKLTLLAPGNNGSYEIV
ncbi:hypothetical protein B566_EDAN016861 [Ephemera danica]|nr:hypothetical protein B566_EDAN016861 [Ephemera danica]